MVSSTRWPGSSGPRSLFLLILSAGAFSVLACGDGGTGPDGGSGSASVSLVWEQTSCIPAGDFGPILLDSRGYHVGFRASGSGQVTITACTQTNDLSSSTQFQVSDGSGYHFRIGVNASIDAMPGVPPDLGNDRFILTSPSASQDWEHGHDYTEFHSINGFALVECS